MTQQSHSYAYTLRKPKLKKMHVSQCSLQCYSQYLGHGNNLDVHWHEWINMMWYIYAMEYYSAIKRNEFESVLVRWMNLEPVCYTQWSMSEREKQILYISAYIWNLEKWYCWTYLKGKNGDTDVENGLVDTVGEGESEMNGESSINICTLSCVEWIAV